MCSNYIEIVLFSVVFCSQFDTQFGSVWRLCSAREDSPRLENRLFTFHLSPLSCLSLETVQNFYFHWFLGHLFSISSCRNKPIHTCTHAILPLSSHQRCVYTDVYFDFVP